MNKEDMQTVFLEVINSLHVFFCIQNHFEDNKKQLRFS